MAIIDSLMRKLPKYNIATAFLDDAAERMSDAQIALNDLEQVILNPIKFYPTITQDQATFRRQKLNTYRRKLVAIADACAISPSTSCREASLQNLPELVPSRAQRSKFNPRIGTEQAVGVIGEGEEKSLVFIGPISWHGQGQQPSVWPAPETTAGLQVVVEPDGGPRTTLLYRLPMKIKGPSRVYMRIIDGTDAEYNDNRCQALPAENMCEVVLY